MAKNKACALWFSLGHIGPELEPAWPKTYALSLLKQQWETESIFLGVFNDPKQIQFYLRNPRVWSH